MAKDVKLRSMLNQQKGRNFKLEKQKKYEREAEKRRATREQRGAVGKVVENLDDAEKSDAEEEESGGVKLNGHTNGKANDSDDEDEDDDEWEDEDEQVSTAHLVDSDESSSEEEFNQEESENEVDDEEEDIALSDLESVASDERGDLIPHQRLTINNKTALLSALNRIQISHATLPFSAHQIITSSEPTVIEDIDDDLGRELAFYKQSLDAVVAARSKLTKEGIPFTRPTDYFAEMVKSDEHMGKIKQKMVDEAANKKAATEARRQRDLKKFGKQVQVAKLQERAKSKRDTLEKITALKRKRSNAPLTNEGEENLFDVGLDNEVSSRPAKKPRASFKKSDGPSEDRPHNAKRAKKNEKYGFGGKKRHSKSGDAQSTSDMRDYPGKRMKQGFGGGGSKGGAKSRPGKARRAKGRL